MIDDDLMGKYIEVDESEEKQIAQSEADAFMKRLQESKAIIEAEGAHTGLCEFCYGTDYLYTRIADDYEGIQFRIDNEIKTFMTCFHGNKIDKEFPF
jgi:hypothetical protein